MRRLVTPHRIDDGQRFRLTDHDPGDTGPFDPEGKEEAAAMLHESVEWLAEAQRKLYAQDRWALLLVFQGMDAAGKDSAIRHVLSGVNPQGCEVHSFKAPSDEERDHDFMWRHARRTPERGRIGIFNRSHYEEVLVVRVHPEILATQKIPAALLGNDLWTARFEDIRNYERYLDRNGIVVRKFFLHVSREKQRKRFLKRLEEPSKHWKFSARDVLEREHWNAYENAYEDAIRNTATVHAPWFVVPADSKWYTRLIVAGAIVDVIHELGVDYPSVDAGQRKALAQARKALLEEG